MKPPVNDYKKEVGAFLRAFRKLGHELIKVDYDNGYGRSEGVNMIALKPTQVSKAVSAICEVDDSHLFMRTPLGQMIWVWFILGNGRGEAVADWSPPRDVNEAKALDKAWSEVSRRMEN